MRFPFMAAVMMVQAAMWMIFSVLAIYAMQSRVLAIGALLLWLIVSSWMISWMHKKAMDAEVNAVKTQVVKNGNSKKGKRV